ncbi:MAG: sugar transferase, partial [Pseudomonadota bacterium]
QRPGRYGRPFQLYKFRTMHVRSGSRHCDDQRTTPFGRFLRQTHLDEWPQLINILLGQMSFVGPRPLLPDDQCRQNSARLRVRPGLTGIAQVSGGRDLSANDKAALDIWYIRRGSFLLDAYIAFQTIRVIISGARCSWFGVKKQRTTTHGTEVLKQPAKG